MFASIDWSRPWFASVRTTAARLQANADVLSTLNHASAALALRNHRGLSIRFVDQSELPASIAYETFISNTGCVPTRHNLHDYFNALVWLTFPTIKRALNELQATHIAIHGIGASRGSVRDQATLFDENAALFVVSHGTDGDLLETALQQHDWQRLFIEYQPAFGNAACVHLFGHALMDKLTAPFKAITAHAWIIRAPDGFFMLPPENQLTWLDQHIAMKLSATSPNQPVMRFFPLPVLGIPGWHAEQDTAFYQDTKVFRSRRTKRISIPFDPH
jgi:hypothetical protein